MFIDHALTIGGQRRRALHLHIAHCTECRAVFLLCANLPPDRWWLRLTFQLLVRSQGPCSYICYCATGALSPPLQMKRNSQLQIDAVSPPLLPIPTIFSPGDTQQLTNETH